MYYRSAGPWGPGKGSNLVAAEFDSNTYQLVQMIDAKAAQGVGLQTFSVVGDQLWASLTDGTILGPYQLPVVSVTFVGQWLPNTQYYVNQIFTMNGATYIVLQNHVSAATFDPGANDGSGNDLYGLLLSDPANALPVGGAPGMVLEKATTTDFAVAWVWPTLAGLHDVLPSPAPSIGEVVYWTGSAFGYKQPPSGTLQGLSDVLPSPPPSLNDVVYWNGSAFSYKAESGGGGGALADLSDVGIGDSFTLGAGDILAYNAGDALWENTPRMPYQDVGWTSYTLQLSDAFNWMDFDNSPNGTLTVPPHSSVSWPQNVFVWFRQSYYGQMTISPGSGVTINTPNGKLAKTRGLGAIIILQQTQFADVWAVSGDLADDLTAATLGGSGGSFNTNQFGDLAVFLITPTASGTYTNNGTAFLGKRISIVITTSGTTSYTVTFGSGFKTTGTLTTGTVSGKVFTISFVGDGTNFNETSRTTAM